MNYCNRTTEDEERMKLRRKKWRKAIIMIAVVLLLCLLGYFIFDGPDRLKEAETRVVLEMVSVAVTAYSQCYQSFPVTAADFDNNPRRIAFFDWGEFNPWSDAWGGPITYTVTGAAGARLVDITSFGRDGIAGGNGFDKDITVTFNEATGTLTLK
jgi:hypothetical protein